MLTAGWNEDDDIKLSEEGETNPLGQTGPIVLPDLGDDFFAEPPSPPSHDIKSNEKKPQVDRLHTIQEVDDQ